MAKEPRLHLVGGFLGSGKTTAIIQSCRLLLAQGLRVGVVTNDQGRYLVDTAFFRLEDLPAVEVGGGCFCCNYGDLEKQLGTLIEKAQPDVIFAESVGSCADLVATVVRPLLELQGSPMAPSSFSVFADSRLLRLRLLGVPLPFSDDVVYIFDEQIEEAGLLVINKSDLLDHGELGEVEHLAVERWPGKALLSQNSLDAISVQRWLERIGTGSPALPAAPLEIDYDRYGAGEARLAWLDEVLRITVVPGGARQAATRIIGGILQELERRGAAVGHLKFALQAPGGGGGKVSFTALPAAGWETQVPEMHGSELLLTVNARVEMPAETLQKLVEKAVEEALAKEGCRLLERSTEAFHPKMPVPTHRL